MDSRWVVPYNPYLSLKYNCHINVEHCASVKSVKYIYKYVYKGHDCTNLEFKLKDNEINEIRHDEIKQFLNARYVSAPEAMWRILEYPLHDSSHTVCRLAVHLENRQSVSFELGKEEDAIQKAALKDTQLTAWFKLNQTDFSSKHLLYHQIPNYFTFKDDKKIWKRRERGYDEAIIGRMYMAHPQEGERYYLRLILLNVSGATSFNDLKTHNGKYFQYYSLKKMNLKIE
jgi:ATP-dependent DNA helicase PIF1